MTCVQRRYLHTPEGLHLFPQQAASDEQGKPAGPQHRPESLQAPVQQAPGPLPAHRLPLMQLAPTLRHSTSGQHVPEMQLPLQQSAPVAHTAPSAQQPAPHGPGAEQTPAWHKKLQQSESLAQAKPSDLQGGSESPQADDASRTEASTPPPP
jgi:hypothetical protein